MDQLLGTFPAAVRFEQHVAGLCDGNMDPGFRQGDEGMGGTKGYIHMLPG